MEANPILLQKKYARVIEKFAEVAQISNREALDFFYASETYQNMREGISDMHCRSELYLAEELQTEYEAKKWLDNVMEKIYTFNEKDITMNMFVQIRAVVKVIQNELDSPFWETLGMFYNSQTYKTLQNTENALWAESPEYIADMFLEEQGMVV